MIAYYLCKAIKFVKRHVRKIKLFSKLYIYHERKTVTTEQCKKMFNNVCTNRGILFINVYHGKNS